MADAEWSEAETSKYQDHVVEHVLGATVLGHFEREEALHLVLDVGLIWTIYADGQTVLALAASALDGLGLDGEERTRIREELHALHGEGPGSPSLSTVRPAPEGCVIGGVEFYEDGGRRLVVIRGEQSGLSVETSAETCRFDIRELSEP